MVTNGHNTPVIYCPLVHESGVHEVAEHGARRAENVENCSKWPKMRTLMVGANEAHARLGPECAIGLVKVLPWVVVGAGGLGAGKTSGAGTRGVSLDVVIGGRTGHSDTNGGESSDNRSKIHADCGPAENPSL